MLCPDLRGFVLPLLVSSVRVYGLYMPRGFPYGLYMPPFFSPCGSFLMPCGLFYAPGVLLYMGYYETILPFGPAALCLLFFFGSSVHDLPRFVLICSQRMKQHSRSVNMLLYFFCIRFIILNSKFIIYLFFVAFWGKFFVICYILYKYLSFMRFYPSFFGFVAFCRVHPFPFGLSCCPLCFPLGSDLLPVYSEVLPVIIKRVRFFFTHSFFISSFPWSFFPWSYLVLFSFLPVQFL